MAVHYVDERGAAVCNRAGFYSERTTDPDKVTCRSCMRVLAGYTAQAEKIKDWSTKNREGSSGYRTGDN